MNKLFFILLSLVLVSFCFANEERLTVDQKTQLTTLSEILQCIYEDNPSAIPSDVNDIAELETSTNSRDMLAFTLFEMMKAVQKGELDLSGGTKTESVAVIETSAPASIIEASLPAEMADGFEAVPMFMMESVEELSGPLESCILQPKTYQITQLPLQITGHVVIPAGTTLIAPYDPNHPIIEVMPGGLLETGKATAETVWIDPNNLPPVRLQSANPNFIYNHNAVGIHIQRGANPQTQIENVIIENCAVGILIDEKIESAIENVIVHGCYDGIWVCAPATIRNCLLWANGTMYADVLNYIGTGIYVWMDWPEDADIIIDRVTLHTADVMLYIDGGSSEPNQAALNISIVNSVLSSGRFYGLYKSPGPANIDVQYCAFGGNHHDSSNIYFPTNCIELDNNPFYNRQQDWEKLYVYPWSPLIDNGYGVVTDGTSMFPDRPDTGRMDIGCHFPIGKTGVFGIPASPADFNGDGMVDAVDLVLINNCMGAISDPNIVRLDGDYDSFVDLPDFRLFANDYGYCNDPNLCTNTDPNCQRSDFNGDHWVDIGDLAIMTAHWLEPVFDEYRVCSLCNLAPTYDPNLPEIIDSDDMNAFMAAWGIGLPDPNCAITFENADGYPIESNQLSGNVCVGVTNYPVSGWMFLQVDGRLVDETYFFDGRLPAFFMPTYEYANGEHTLTVGGYFKDVHRNNGCWMQSFSVTFENGLYLASIPDMYEKDESYQVKGFFDSDTVTLATDPNDGIMFDGGCVDYSTVLHQTGDALLTVCFASGGTNEIQNCALNEKIDIAKLDPNSYRAVIIAPDKRVNRAMEDHIFADNRLLTAIRQTLEAANIPYVELIHKNACWDNIKLALTAPKMNYVYWISHANSHVGKVTDEATGAILEPGIQRTVFPCWNRKRFRDKESFVFSWLKSDSGYVPVEVPDLPDGLDERGHSMTSLKLWESKTIKEFWAIGCLSAVKWEGEDWNDMAMAVGVYNYRDTQGNYTHVYIGNQKTIMAGGVHNLLIGYPSAISKIIRRHDTTNLENALNTHDLEENELLALWGKDFNRDGYTDNVLQWWPRDIALWRVIFQ